MPGLHSQLGSELFEALLWDELWAGAENRGSEGKWTLHAGVLSHHTAQTLLTELGK